ncbi:hypothetical protein BOTBODRAFT_301735 [Botryobasidium botryosum FD-172 SS1]|uniref:Uncharacterized protein n=1 Tax=Botryobasidium botryosum (strain FD-172 SS1) TaxID=930990 RepID=A0A067MU33_BOTB1|nr:hypothetical protein BOTBODRAFT_301735 [Botryobasidium botryosum FD-172 SS1]
MTGIACSPPWHQSQFASSLPPLSLTSGRWQNPLCRRSLPVRGTSREIVGDNPEEDAKTVPGLPTTITRKAIWKRDNLPYTVLRAVITSVTDAESEHKRIKSELASTDEWCV